MWVNAKELVGNMEMRLLAAMTKLEAEQTRRADAEGYNRRLEIENTRLRSDLDWFKHRVTQLEKERGQLMLDRLGLAVPVPQFEPTHRDPAEALNQMPRLDTVGNDATDEPEEDDNSPAAMLGRELAVSYDMMPRRK